MSGTDQVTDVQITDAQIHIWSAGKPSAHQRPEPFPPDLLLREMRAAGVDQAVVVPPSWDPAGNAPANQAAEAHPGKLAVMGRMDLNRPESRDAIAKLGETPKMLGFRLMFTTPERRAPLLDGRAEWLWAAAEKADVPLMIHVPDDLKATAGIAERHPGLRLVIDHLGVPPGHSGEDVSFAHIPDLVALARLPNVAVKATGVPGYSNVPYPYADLHDTLHRVFDAFGPKRLFWGSDLTRLQCSYRQCVTLFTEELPWLSGSDKAGVMGGGVREWLRWR